MAARLTALIVVGIVAVTLIAGLIVGAQRDDDSGPVDVLILNGRVYSADGGATFAEAVAIRANQVLRIGSNRDLKRLRGIGTTVIDAHGGAVIPGFNDAHAHMLAGALARGTLDLRSATTLEQVEQMIQSYAERHADAEWITGFGWRFNAFSDGVPTRRLLDTFIPDRPVYLVAEDGRTAWTNSTALAAAGVPRSPRDASGIPKDDVQKLLERALPRPTREEQIEAVRSAVAAAHRYGVTSVQDMDAGPDALDVYDALRKDGDLKLRVYAVAALPPDGDTSGLQRLEDGRKQFPDDPLLKAGAVRIAVDGSVETHTAALLTPYANRRTAGRLWIAPEKLRRLVGMLDRAGWQVVLEASGDSAVQTSLQALESAAADAAPTRGRRHRLERIDVVDSADVPRFRAGGIVASIQPTRAQTWFDPLGVFAANLGPDRATAASWPAFIEAGAHVAFGSDWPSGSLNPLSGLAVALRPRVDAEPSTPDVQLRLLTRTLDAYTRGAAFVSFDEQRKGALARGMLADIVILSSDIFGLGPERLSDVQVEHTIFDGKVVYTRQHSATTQ